MGTLVLDGRVVQCPANQLTFSSSPGRELGSLLRWMMAGSLKGMGELNEKSEKS